MSVTFAQAAPYVACAGLCVSGMLMSFWSHYRMKDAFLSLDKQARELVRKGPFLGDVQAFIAVVVCYFVYQTLDGSLGFTTATLVAVLGVLGTIIVRRVLEHRRLRGVNVPEQFRSRLLQASFVHLASSAVGIGSGLFLVVALKQQL